MLKAGVQLVNEAGMNHAELRGNYPGKTSELEFLSQIGFDQAQLRTAAQASARNVTTIEQELIAAKLISPDDYYRHLASRLGLEFVEWIDPEQVVSLEKQEILLRRQGPLRYVSGKRIMTAIVPEARHTDIQQSLLARHPSLKETLVVSTPQAIRNAVWESGAQARVKRTTHQLSESASSVSARMVMTPLQSFLAASMLAALVAAFFAWTVPMLTLLHTALSLLYLSNIVLRVTAAISWLAPVKAELPKETESGLPVYTILIALHDEAEIAGQLVRAMDRLQWPKSLLDIKFVCEAADLPTIQALLAARPGPECEIVRVPRMHPMTKPKALQYALEGARGSIVAVYDAEDMPHPAQLREAHARLSEGGLRLGCVQAPLAIANRGKNWISALFAIEYSGLFRVLLPFLDRMDLPILLGGTSNHFRREALEDSGGWDPFNVTEDADLGMRLYRRGYRTGLLRHATIENAPERLDVWIRQRSRWLKGWAQTWLVLMRNPFRLLGELGVSGFAAFQVLIVGMLISALTHPAMILFVGIPAYLLMMGDDSMLKGINGALFAVDTINILGSYIAFLILGWIGLVEREKVTIRRRWLAMLPIYWLAMSWAAWRALQQLPFRAHFWEKTPHPAPQGMDAAAIAVPHDRMIAETAEKWSG